MGNQLKHDIHEYMRTHPGVKYTEARNAVLAKNKQPLLGGAMSDMIGRILGAGTPAPDLETAMQNLGFEFPPNPETVPPVAASDVRQGDVVKIGDRYGLIIKNDTALLDGKLVSLVEVANQEIEFYRMPSPRDTTEQGLSAAQDEARAILPLSTPGARVEWHQESIPVYALQLGDIMRLGEQGEFGIYDGKGGLLINGETHPLGGEGGDTDIFRPYFGTTTSSARDRANTLTVMNVLGDTSILSRWEKNELDNNLFVPLGHVLDEGNRVVGINLAEYSQGGTGPHGVLQGMTGTGKTAFTDNILLALAATNSPSKLNFVYASFYGTHAVNAAKKEFPHTVWADEINDDGEGFAKFLNEEMTRREEFLHQHASRSIVEYTELRKADRELPDLPRLLVVVEEPLDYLYAHRKGSVHREMKAVAHKGRSLGIHLLLTAQYIDTSLVGEIMSHITYAVSLHVHSQANSRTVLDGNPGAAQLPIGKGDALLRSADRYGETHVEPLRGFFPLDRDERAKVVAGISSAAEEWSA